MTTQQELPKAHALDGGTAPLLQIAPHWPAASDARRWRRPHAMITITTRLAMTLVLACLACQPGCSHSSGPSSVQVDARSLSPREAAELAARLANDQCERQYRKRPFSAEQHVAVLENGLYQWGGLDVGGPGGLSAVVTFRPDGAGRHVEVYFSSDER